MGAVVTGLEGGGTRMREGGREEASLSSMMAVERNW
jgi:hypothetical protein